MKYAITVFVGVFFCLAVTIASLAVPKEVIIKTPMDAEQAIQFDP